jgi:hypothetical protein
LLGSKHEVVAAVRSHGRAHDRLGPDVETVDVSDDRALQQALERADAVINLAGENVLGGRWTRARRRALQRSRVELTERLVLLMGRCRMPPHTLLSASAVGVYGDRGQQVLDEGSELGSGFLADLCRRWESAALAAQRHGTRVAVFRIGIVLGADGGALRSMLPAFQLGLGGRLGHGRQQVSWIHLHDLVELLIRSLDDRTFEGPINAVGPHPVSNAEWTRQLAQALGRPAPWRIPRLLLWLVLGRASRAVLQSQHVLPQRAEALGFRFQHRSLQDALAHIVAPLRQVRIDRVRKSEATVVGIRQRRPQYVLTQRSRIAAPIEQVFPFFSRPHNLALLTPGWTQFQFIGPLPDGTHKGLEIDYRIGLGPVRFPWRSRITAFDSDRRFVDEQVRGPYALWHHEHAFQSEGSHTLMIDRVHYRLPLGPLGRLVHPIAVGPMLRRIFAYRAEAIALRFRDPATENAADDEAA